METKSRYEIIAELEDKKSKLLNARASVGLQESQLNMQVEKAKDNLENFLVEKDIQAKNIEDQLESIERSLDRLNQSQKK